MTPLLYLAEPLSLLLTWQPPDETAVDRTRRTVGQLYDNQGTITFRYLRSLHDFQIAKDAGFRGFPAFDVTLETEFTTGAVEPFFRRLPPRNREDFREYLAQHRLPFPFPSSDLSLLGYTGARLPGDGFSLVPIFDPTEVPIDYVTEVAGVRHVFQGKAADLQAGDPVHLRAETNNAVDPDAIAIYWHDEKLGYVNRILRKTFSRWIADRTVTATVDRSNGKPHRPLVYLRIEVR